ncbi:hypothetical protein CEXT_799891 [Caerostris extrusa]|uniref:Uncharacterized protein n=1 Tax=Caerostris extrusa TaxID=172846 RepID=A0AAV4QH47_CAEEX|nr:hypothetical protein CEXT_799891 [Caerostris extrusa]
MLSNIPQQTLFFNQVLCTLRHTDYLIFGTYHIKSSSFNSTQKPPCFTQKENPSGKVKEIRDEVNKTLYTHFSTIPSSFRSNHPLVHLPPEFPL